MAQLTPVLRWQRRRPSDWSPKAPQMDLKPVALHKYNPIQKPQIRFYLTSVIQPVHVTDKHTAYLSPQIDSSMID